MIHNYTRNEVVEDRGSWEVVAVAVAIVIVVLVVVIVGRNYRELQLNIRV